MSDALFWIYLANATLLIVHEIDSAYWKEWELFRLPGGAGGFVLLHIPLVFLFILGLVWTYQGRTAGLVFSFILALAGVGAFSIHTWFMRRGRHEFKTTVSRLVLVATLLASLVQIVITLVEIIS